MTNETGAPPKDWPEAIERTVASWEEKDDDAKDKRIEELEAWITRKFAGFDVNEAMALFGAVERVEQVQWVKDLADDVISLESKLAKAMDGLRECEGEIDQYIRQEYPHDHPVQERYRQRDFAANPARATLAELSSVSYANMKGTD